MSKLRLFFAVIVAAAIFGGLIWMSGPGLMRDWRMRGVETVEVGSELTDGNCRVYVFLINFCSFKLRTENALVDDNLIFVDMNMNGYDIVARAETTDPTHVTTSLALNMFWDRVATLVGFLALIGFGVISGVAGLFRRAPQPAT